jgi:hypothetical protein
MNLLDKRRIYGIILKDKGRYLNAQIKRTFNLYMRWEKQKPLCEILIVFLYI